MTDRTFAFDDQLPRVPLPTLEDSCARFLEWSAPLLTEDERAAAERAVAGLLRPDGPARLQHAARERRRNGASNRKRGQPVCSRQHRKT
uniref:choline/carnitine O-acyltransferase n=1 Tax=Nocardia wallacei TaxID=480035 RepID=UPI0024550C1E